MISPQSVLPAASDTQLDPYTMVPTLSQHLHDSFGGPHTQFACSCFYGHQNGSLVPCQVVVSCTQMFLCDAESFVIRVALLNRLLAIYQRDVPLQGASPSGSRTATETEVLLVFDREPDMLLRGHLTCDGSPAKPMLQTLLSLQRVHCPNAPVALHLNSSVPLKDIAKLKPPSGYVAPLPQREETWEQCPCWRAADVLNISDEEFATRLRNLCIVYCPEKLPNVPELCRKYCRKKGGVLQHMVQQYGPEPSEEHAMAVYKVLQREEKFADILRSAAAVLPSRRHGGAMQTSEFMGTAANQPQAVPLSTLFSANKKLKQSLLPDANPLYFPVLKLIDQPSGGYGRLHIRVKPVPFIQVQQDVVSKFSRRPREPHFEFWYLTNEGYVLPFDISQEIMQPFGYEHGDRVLATWGVTRGRWSTIVGVRDGTLWVHDDGDIGASALIGFGSRDELERCNGWVKHDQMSMPLRETSVMEILTLPDLQPRALIINPDIVHERCGFYHGEVVKCFDPCSHPFHGIAVIAGVDAADEQTVYAFFIDPSDEGLTQEMIFAQQLKQQRKLQSSSNQQQQVAASSSGADDISGSNISPHRVVAGSAFSSKRINPSRAAAQPLIRCQDANEIKSVYGWKSIGAARVLCYTPSNQNTGNNSSTNFTTRPSSVIL